MTNIVIYCKEPNKDVDEAKKLIQNCERSVSYTIVYNSRYDDTPSVYVDGSLLSQPLVEYLETI